VGDTERGRQLITRQSGGGYPQDLFACLIDQRQATVDEAPPHALIRNSKPKKITQQIGAHIDVRSEGRCGRQRIEDRHVCARIRTGHCTGKARHARSNDDDGLPWHHHAAANCAKAVEVSIDGTCMPAAWHWAIRRLRCCDSSGMPK
jgi:hypothetical protein